MKVLEVYESFEFTYIVLEKMDGKDLFDYLKARDFKLSEKRTIQIISKILSAV
jgi:serine/threonine protein kinase